MIAKFVILVITIEKIDESFGSPGICSNKNFKLDEFKTCVEENSSITLMRNESFSFDMDMYSIYHIFKPEDGSIRLNEGSTTKLVLKPNNSYFVSFYDQNFVLRSNNPEIVPKSGITIKKNAWAFIYIKVLNS